MAKSNAVRRLERILADEEFGPKLARLNRRDESHILDLIERNEGKKARTEILRLDEKRRATIRERKYIRRRGPVLDSSILRRKAAANIIRQVGGNPAIVSKHVKYMDTEDLSFAAIAAREELKAKAREAAYIDAPDIEYDINPFWYH